MFVQGTGAQGLEVLETDWPPPTGRKVLGDVEPRPGLRAWGGVQTVAEAEGRAGEAAGKGNAAGPKPPLPLQALGAAPGFGTPR